MVATLSPLAERRKRWAMELGDEFAGQFQQRFEEFNYVTERWRYRWLHTPEFKYLNLPFSTDPKDSVGISWLWGLTVETLPGAAFFYIRCWHDGREHYFDMPVMEAAELALRWARFTADNWPDKSERWKLQLFVRTLGPLLYVNAMKWKMRGKR